MMYSCFEITTYITFSGKFLKFYNFSIKCAYFIIFIYVYQINNYIVGNLKKSFSVVHLIDL